MVEPHTNMTFRTEIDQMDPDEMERQFQIYLRKIDAEKEAQGVESD